MEATAGAFWPKRATAVRLERDLEGGRLQVAGQHVRVLGINHGVLRRLRKEVLRVTQQVLIDGIISGQEDRQALAAAAAATAGLLPRAGDRAWVVNQQRDIERTDVDSQFERIRRCHAA